MAKKALARNNVFALHIIDFELLASK